MNERRTAQDTERIMSRAEEMGLDPARVARALGHRPKRTAVVADGRSDEPARMSLDHRAAERSQPPELQASPTTDR